MFNLKKEIVIFISLFIFLALGMHMTQWVSHPIEHFENLSKSQFGPFHPLYFTFGTYVVIFIIRAIFASMMNIVKKKD